MLTVPSSAKKDIIEQEYDIPLEDNFGRSVNVMCNLSEAVWEEAMEEGVAQGIERVRKN